MTQMMPLTSIVGILIIFVIILWRAGLLKKETEVKP